MKKVLKTERERIIYNCRKATYLIERKQQVELTAREKMELKLHLVGCVICRVYEQQSILINKMMGQLMKGDKQEIKLDDAFKEKLQKKIEEKVNGRI